MCMDNCISGNRWGMSIDGHDIPFSRDDSGSSMCMDELNIL